MIAFATLWLGIVTGAMPVEVLAGPEVARVELRLDGAPCAALDRPPWSATCDLGAELAPHELVATAFDGADREVGEIRQWLNLPRPAAELDVVLAQEGPGAVIATSLGRALAARSRRRYGCGWAARPCRTGAARG